jgi:hypothetical protein
MVEAMDSGLLEATEEEEEAKGTCTVAINSRILRLDQQTASNNSFDETH